MTSMRKRLLGCLPLLLLLPLLAGCQSERPLAQLPPISDRMFDRAEGMSSVLNRAPLRGVELDRFSFDLFYGQFNLLLARLQKLNLTRLYVVIESPEFLEENHDALLELAESSAAAGIGVEMMLPQRHFLPRRRGNVWVRKLGNPDTLTPLAGLISDFNDDLSRKAKLAGVTIKAEIHNYAFNSPELPGNALYSWSDDSYGIGLDNDMLMRNLLLDLKKFRDQLDSELTLTAAVPDFYHDRAAAGELSCGKVEDFLAVADRAIVFGRGYQPSVFFGSMRPELQSSGVNDRVLMGIFISSHAVESQTALRRRGWDDFSNIMQYLIDQGAAYPAFGGLVLDSWRNLESLWERE